MEYHYRVPELKRGGPTSGPKVGVCVPTVRRGAVAEFLREWGPLWDGAADPAVTVLLFVHEDRSGKTLRSLLPSRGGIYYTSREDIQSALGAAAWIISTGSGASRSFPMYLAWKAGCDYVITLDDDCYPQADSAKRFIERHLEAFTRDRWFRTIAGDEPRGIPYERLGDLPVRVNHGLWVDVPDLDGPTSLVRIREPRTPVLPTGSTVIPPGMAFPLSAMNVCYHRSVVPVAYHLLMGLETVGFDRFDDIWSGLLVKRVLDYMGWYVTTGEPFVRHVKRSNRFTNLRQEALGLQIHEYFWEYVLETPLGPGLSPTDAYRALALRVSEFPSRYPDLPCPAGYFKRLSEAMIAWSGLFSA